MKLMNISRPKTDEYDPFYETYVSSVSSDDILSYLTVQGKNFVEFVQSIPEDRHIYAYQKGKWTVKQLLRHIIDAERMFAFRAMAIARGEQEMLPGFDEQRYVENADDSENTMQDLLEEFESLRTSNVCMISRFTTRTTARIGNANGSRVSVRAILFIIAGHLAHHKKIITERYLAYV